MKQSVYRIYTERINYEGIIALVSRYFEGATFTHTTGLWKGKLENGIIIELWTEDAGLVNGLACSIQFANKQETVAITHHEVDLRLTSGKCCQLGTCADHTPAKTAVWAPVIDPDITEAGKQIAKGIISKLNEY